MNDLPFTDLDSAGVARTLAQIADRPEDLADVFFERTEQIELPPETRPPGLRVWRESGFAIRLLRDRRTWLAGRDRIDRETFRDALRRVARAMPRAPYPQPELGENRWSEPPAAPEVSAFPAIVERALRTHSATFPVALTIRRHLRWVRVIGTQLSSGTEHERYYSFLAEMPWASYGGLLPALCEATAEKLARNLVYMFQGQQTAPPAAWRGTSILGPAATAVLLHEAVAHALEADTLALGGQHPESAIGVRMGSALLDVFDDPASAPAGVRRVADDEGFPVLRRCLLRAGIVDQPICDLSWSRRSDVLSAGAGRRGNRHLPPGPRSSHLVLVPGELSQPDLMEGAEGGLYLPEADRGHLDPLTGDFTLHFPYARRIRHQVPGPPVGPCSLRGRINDVLERVTGVGQEARAAGAGWCAKGGIKLPVWATCPALRLHGVEISP